MVLVHSFLFHQELPRDINHKSAVLSHCSRYILPVLIDFSLTVKAANLIFISRRGSAISSAKQGKSGSIYNLVKNK